MNALPEGQVSHRNACAWEPRWTGREVVEVTAPSARRQGDAARTTYWCPVCQT